MADEDLLNYNKQSKKNIKPVVTDKSEVVLKKKTPGKKFAEIFLSDDLGSVKKYAIYDVIIPAIKDTIVKIVKDGVEMLFYGSPQHKSRSSTILKGYESTTYVPYSGYSSKKNQQRRREPEREFEKTPDYDEIILVSRGTAEEIIIDMREIIAEFGSATVGDLYTLIDITPDFTAYDYGWTNLDDAYVKPVHRGYLLVLPKPKFIDIR